MTRFSEYREEHSRQLWSELEELIQAHSDTSSDHQQILDMLLNLKPSYADTATAGRKKRGLNERADSNMPIKDDSSENGGTTLSKMFDSAVSTKKSRMAGPAYNFKGMTGTHTMSPDYSRGIQTDQCHVIYLQLTNHCWPCG